MGRRLIVRLLAESDLQGAALWYDRERFGLGRRFLDDVDRTFVRIREHPRQFPNVSAGVRRALLHAFPYAVYFTTTPDDDLLVLAVLHLKRHPSSWLRRI
jgi:plasmid stabilization system protein ParE